MKKVRELSFFLLHVLHLERNVFEVPSSFYPPFLPCLLFSLAGSNFMLSFVKKEEEKKKKKNSGRVKKKME